MAAAAVVTRALDAQTTSDYYAVGSKTAQLKVATTEVKDSTLQQLPFVGQLVEDVKFPTREALEQVRAGTRARVPTPRC